MVNNPWGNRGRKKCGACRSRKRSVCSLLFDYWWKCEFNSETDACHFCVSHEVKCGPKVFAEKAKYYRTRVSEIGECVETINIVHSVLSASSADKEMVFPQQEASSNSPFDTEYTLRSNAQTLLDPTQMNINIGLPANTKNDFESGIP